MKTQKLISVPQELAHIPFLAGGMGFFGYDLALQQKTVALPEVPQALWVFYRLIYVYDHRKREAFFIFVAESSLDIQKIKEGIFKQMGEAVRLITKLDPKTLRVEMGYPKYLQTVQKVLDYIQHGHIYQANLTYRMHISNHLNCPWTVFEHISREHKTPFAAFLNTPNFQVLSFSPERFVQAQKKQILVQPMKGTRPRCPNNWKQDQKLGQELLNSQKDLAELTMIVDLLRNDLGKIALPGTVCVKKFPELHVFKSIYQLTASISAQLNPCFDLVDLVEALFPSGSISGCPKIRAIQIIEQLEIVSRSLFMGSLGYISFHETLDLNVLIRTLLFTRSAFYFQVGSGIVWDSVPLEEYHETLDKGRFFFQEIFPN